MPVPSGRKKSHDRSLKPNVRVKARGTTRAGKSGSTDRRIKVWLALLVVWLALLSGGAAPWTGTPGVLQTLHLHSFLGSKQAEQAKLQTEIEHLRSEAALLERSRAAQHREIRRVLGYAASDEIIFDFDSREPL